jgi:hypothetical protein
VSLALQRHGGADLERYARGAAAGRDKEKEGQGNGVGGTAVIDAGGTDGAKQAGEELERYVQQLQATFLAAAAQAGGGGGEAGEEGGGGEAAAAAAQQLQWSVEQLAGVVRQAAAPAAAKHAVLRFLALHALFRLDAAAAKKVGWGSSRGAGGAFGGCKQSIGGRSQLSGKRQNSDRASAWACIACTGRAGRALRVGLPAPRSGVASHGTSMYRPSACPPRRARTQRCVQRPPPPPMCRWRSASCARRAC